jgi:hypothetical protein
MKWDSSVLQENCMAAFFFTKEIKSILVTEARRLNNSTEAV